ncbi:glutathione S-transferase N-terminal domain-containing protein [Candidatus Venteria ishoeyi]|uniref:Glutaredoxin 2 n=1 Tax=Candidatus Venteria ishoeyi TaxID=1899563 RepID=A0A1H6F9P1_9GAMM|nr:glutathione S-transferase N-terminal domain-containing protein [Candidatus Venteria ishoeyi]MDM8545244.1 glutathione S-transferase N-terminal domain-containing protein [Candidatus Venteria ishoeyi]SEH06817.1 glutaredoxin 2 [Candidatus Venteria ishoeyi]
MNLLAGIKNFLMGGKPQQRSPEAQAQVNENCVHLSLYHFPACPYCIKVRRQLWRLNLPIELRNAQKYKFSQALLEQGGLEQVPCLRIEELDGIQWLYESDAIIHYLQQHFS